MGINQGVQAEARSKERMERWYGVIPRMSSEAGGAGCRLFHWLGNNQEVGDTESLGLEHWVRNR